jgi:hypothetical protein
MNKYDKAFVKVTFFLMNLMVIGLVLGLSTQLGFEIYILTMIGAIGWVMFSMPIFFSNWALAVKDFSKYMERKYDK